MNVRLLGKWGFGEGYMCDELISDSITYVASGSGLFIFDIRNPSSIEKIGELNTLGVPFCFSRFGNLLCLAEKNCGVSLYDITDLRNPRFLGRYVTPHNALSVYFNGRYAYAACWESGLIIIDFSNPQNPREVGNFDTPGWAIDIAVQGNYAYIADAFEGMRIINIENPENPYEVGYYWRYNAAARSICVKDTLAFICFELSRNGGLVVVNVKEPTQPQYVSRIDVGTYSMAVVLSGNYAYLITDLTNAINIIDISRPESLRLVGRYLAPNQRDSWFRGIAAKGNFCYSVLQWYEPRGDLFIILDVTDPTNPRLVGTSEPFPGPTWSILARGDIVFTGHYDDGVRIFDVSNLSQIREIGRCQVDTSLSEALAVDSNFLYITSCKTRKTFKIFDISDPENPRFVSAIDSFGYGSGIAVRGRYAYFAFMPPNSESSFLWVIDISDPSRPVRIASRPLHQQGHEVDIDGDYCAVAIWLGGVILFDISDPHNPREVSQLLTPDGSACDLRLSYPYIYFVEIPGFGVIDISDPENPILIAYDTVWNRYPYPEAALWGIDIYGDLAFLAAGLRGVMVYDISNPFRPREIGFHSPSDWSSRVHYDQGKIYVADYSGFCIFEYFGPHSIKEKPIAKLKRPSSISKLIKNGRLFLEHNLKGEGEVRISIINSLGRVERMIKIGNDRGDSFAMEIDISSLPGGIYFLQLELGKERIIEKFIIIR